MGNVPALARIFSSTSVTTTGTQIAAQVPSDVSHLFHFTSSSKYRRSFLVHYAILSASTHQLPQSKYTRFTLTHDLMCSNNVSSSPSLYTWQYR